MRNTFRFALGNLADFDPSRDAVRRRTNSKSSIAGCCRAPPSWCGSAAHWYDILRFPPRLSRAARFCRGGSQRVLFRRAEGPALHLRPAQPRAALGANRDVPHRQRVAAAGRADPLVHLRGDLEVFSPSAQAIPTACTWRCSRSRKIWALPSTKRSESAWESCSNCAREVLKALEDGAQRAKSSPAALEAKVRIHSTYAERSDLLRKYTTDGCRRSSSSRRWKSLTTQRGRCPKRNRSAVGDRNRARRRQKVRALLELFDARRRKRRLPHGLRALRRRAA